ncbi:glycosyltransferase family 2 protein [Lacticaseibacillus paracasei]|uniref:glycosyltransferase family 2 protein n=1 Tax=Lacticaseibacillus paracasei TaxID=1597 RepID=UPI000A3B5FEA|nr:glycosyltransferase [Lacticaseibacillus paracasei]OUC67075.1 glycosyl transferase, group 2 family protein [Lacticaseibacillus paracasei]
MSYLDKNDLTILIVTYAKRWPYLKKSLEHLLSYNEYIANVILVQNGADYDLKKQLFDTPSLAALKINLILHQKNEGSAGGFGSGIEFARRVDGKYLLILDDDNFMPEEAFTNLQQLDNNYLAGVYGSKYAISLFRPGRDQDPNKFKSNVSVTSKYYRDTVADFSLMHKFNKTRYLKLRENESIAEQFTVPYSGLLIHKRLLRKAEPVQKAYYLYGDDTRFTMKLSQQGIRFLTFKNIYSTDMERSWFQDGSKTMMASKNAIDAFLHIQDKQDLLRPFYQIRNAVNTSNTVLKHNEFLYLMNFLIFLITPLFIYMPKNKLGWRNYRVFWKAVVDGQRGILGKIDNVP